MRKVISLKKPSFETARAFAEGTSSTRKEQSAEKSSETRNGQIPNGDVRLTANIRQDLHLKLKIRAAERRTTVGELIEEWIESLPR